jgi:hypothetical protein
MQDASKDDFTGVTCALLTMTVFLVLRLRNFNWLLLKKDTKRFEYNYKD